MRWALVLVMAGCSGSAVPDASVNVDSVTEYCAAQSDAFCAKAQRCGQQSVSASCPQPRSDCAEAYRTRLDGGAMRFDQDAADACLAELATQDCQSRPPSSCQQVFVGAAQLDQSCWFTCAPGLSCAITSLTACGRCVVDSTPAYRYPTEGERCFVPELDGPGCASGLGCVPGDGGTACEPLQPIGAPCSGHRCEVGLQCAFEDGGARCVTLGEVGGECDQQHQCKGYLTCQAGHCTTLLPDAAPCVDSSQCESLHCTEGTCTLGVVNTVGGNCLNATCGSGLFCRADSRCAARVPRGGACKDAECEFGNSCIDHVCRDRALECR